jgi:hypothetical protein
MHFFNHLKKSAADTKSAAHNIVDVAVETPKLGVSTGPQEPFRIR